MPDIVVSDLAFAAVTEFSEIPKPLLNGYRLDVVQVLACPFRKNPASEITQVSSPGFLGFVIRKKFSLAVMVIQVLERHQRRPRIITVDVRSQELDSI